MCPQGAGLQPPILGGAPTKQNPHRPRTLPSRTKHKPPLAPPKILSLRRHENGTHQTPDPLRFHGASPAPRPSLSGCWRSSVTPTASTASPLWTPPRHRVGRDLAGQGGGETEKQIYRFTKGDSDLALRFDLTVPLAKYVALHYADLAFPFRRYQIGKVYRGERAQRGRFREFYQCDIDVIGDGKLDIANEAEIPAIIYQAFTALGLERFRIRVNNRKILTGFYAMEGLEAQAGDIMRTVDKLDKIGPERSRPSS